MNQRKSGSHPVPQYPYKEMHLSFASKQAECERCSTAVVLTDDDSEIVSFPRYHKDSRLFFDRIVNALRMSVPATLCAVDKALKLTAYYLLLFRCQNFLKC